MSSTLDLVAKLRVAYQRWHDTRGQSVADWLALMSDEIQLRSVADGAPGLEFSAPRKGKAAAQVYFSALHTDWEMIYYTVEEFVVAGDTVVVFSKCAWRNRKTGKIAESPIINRLQFRDGLVVEYYEYYDTAKAFAATIPDPV
jgi:ketosteroid isomerase-like protein